MKKNVVLRAVVLSAALGIIGSAAAIVYGVRAAAYEKRILASNENAFYELAASARRMAEDISSLKYGTSGLSLAETATRIWGDSRAAASSLALLPLKDERLSAYEKLINQAGDYSLSLLRLAADGGRPGTDQINDLDALAEAMNGICSRLGSARELLECGSVSFDSLGSSIYGADLSGVEKLVYDGAFTDPSDEETAYAAPEGNAVSREKAQTTAREYVGEEVSPAYETAGTPAVFGFSFGEGGFIEISKLGGHIVTLSRKPPEGEAVLSAQDARSVFLSECERLGLEKMTCRRLKTEDGIVSAELVPFEDGVYLYPDAVRLSISSADGSLVRADCKSYYENHRERETVTSGALPDGASFALIKSEGGKEMLCFELLSDGVLTYLNPESGTCRRFSVLAENEIFLSE